MQEQIEVFGNHLRRGSLNQKKKKLEEKKKKMGSAESAMLAIFLLVYIDKGTLYLQNYNLVSSSPTP